MIAFYVAFGLACAVAAETYRRRRSTDAPPLPAWLRGLVVLGAIGLCACAIFISYAYPY